MATAKNKWTAQQKLAITKRGSDVLVTASAGTGKTAVLSGRCVDIVSDKAACPDVGNILVLTFTEAAAEEMRSRIAEQLKEAYEKSGDKHLRHQMILLPAADISTIHSFCKRLITENFYKLALDPSFGIIEGDEQRLLKAEALEKTIEWAWQQDNLTQGLCELFNCRDVRSNDGFLANIIAASDFLDGVVSRENWLERAILLSTAVHPQKCDLGEKQKKVLEEKLNHILNRLKRAQKLYDRQCPGGNWSALLADSHLSPIIECSKILKKGDLSKLADEIRNFQKPRTSTPKDIDKAMACLIHDIAKDALDKFKGLTELAVLNSQYFDVVGATVSLQTRIVVELIKKFDQFYGEAKSAINCLDFADLEHYALKLLTVKDGDKLSPSETAVMLRSKYKYIFVDEYQDINPVQQAILDLVSSEGNVFVVGDIKQSIYAFRGAKPDIFLERLAPASTNPSDAADALRVDLNANFRSSKGILDFVNKLFGRIMTGTFAKIDYDESAKLKPGGESETTKADKPIVELHILEAQGRQDDEEEPSNEPDSSEGKTDSYSARQHQAALIAERIQKIVGAQTGGAEFEIFDKQSGKSRQAEYRDIVILMRSPAKRVNDYIEVLRLAGVPVSSEDSAGYFEATEISDCLCLLKVLDNPQRDIELAAVLRSPFFNITDSQLAIIAVHARDKKVIKGYYEAVIEYVQNGREAKLAEKLKETLAVLERWRVIGRRGNLADLIWRVYRETGYLSFVSALASGKGRRANLLKLHERAIQFEGFASSGGIASLGRFVEFIEKIQQAGQDWSSAEPEAEAQNAVRIMSVHKSKGLEFPVVFLAELNSRFNKSDTQGDFLLDYDNTLGLQIIDKHTNCKLNSMAHQVIAEEKRSAGLAEEMRILYVATTRARERLILTGCGGQTLCRGIIVNGCLFETQPIDAEELRHCRSPLEWVLYGLSDQKRLNEIFETGLAENCGDENLFSAKYYGQEEISQLSERLDNFKKKQFIGTKPKVKGGAGKELLTKVKENLNWHYKYSDITRMPAKQSVTQMTHSGDEFVKIDYNKELTRRPKCAIQGTDKIDSRLMGTAAHIVISKLDLTKDVSVEAIERIKEKLLAEGAISKEAFGQIESGAIQAFFESEHGKEALDRGNTVWREWPFSFAIPVSQWPQEFDNIGVGESEIEDHIIIQGIIDMLIRTPAGLKVVDFKTDNIAANNALERAGQYRKQLELYGKAASAIMGVERVEKWLYFLKPGCAIKI